LKQREATSAGAWLIRLPFPLLFAKFKDDFKVLAKIIFFVRETGHPKFELKIFYKIFKK
jgi:hypothetical protein